LGEKEYAIPGTVTITYRIFEEKIDDNYFCQAIPPSVPKVLKELIATDGTLIINTVEKESNGTITGYDYEITMANLLFNDGEERIFFENFVFGTFSKNN
jgi:hypothetical protein